MSRRPHLPKTVNPRPSTTEADPEPARCGWCAEDPLLIAYHDHEWGVPLKDDTALFEMLLLEGVQAGLSWLTVLKRRAAYRYAFHHFDMETIARYDETDITRLLGNAAIIRNRLKIEAAVKNARGALAICEEYGSLALFLWRYVEYTPIQNVWRHVQDIPTHTIQSQQMSRDLKKRGFNFVGPTICYAFMQATGMVNDHTTDCFLHARLREHCGFTISACVNKAAPNQRRFAE